MTPMLPFIKKPNPFAPRRYGNLQAVTKRVYLWRNITNSSFVVGDESVAVIDTQVNPPSAEEFLKALRAVTDKPIRYVINTHYHWDHTNGNQLFKNEGAEIVSSALTKDFMTRRAPRQKEFLAGRGFELNQDPLLPETIFENELTLDLGGMPIRLFFAGSAETEDATAVEVPREGVVMSGDTVMTGSFPIFGQPVWDEGLEGDRRWIETIQNLMLLKPKHILPGHGPLAHSAEIALLTRIQEYFLAEVGRCVQRGFSVDQTLRDLEPGLPDWIRRIPVVWGTPRYAILRVYRGLTKKNDAGEPGWQKFKPSAIPSADPAKVSGKTLRAETPEDFIAMAREASEGGDAGMTLDILKKGAETFPSSDKILNEYAEALIRESRVEASVLEKGDFFQIARRCWDSVLSRDADNLDALLGKGRYLTMMAYRGGDDPRGGMKLLERVIAASPGGRLQAEAEFYLGMGYRRLGNEKLALAQFQKSRRLDAGFVPARLAAG